MDRAASSRERRSSFDWPSAEVSVVRAAVRYSLRDSEATVALRLCTVAPEVPEAASSPRRV